MRHLGIWQMNSFPSCTISVGKVSVHKAKLEDLDYIEVSLRASDVDDLLATTDLPAADVIRAAYERSVETFAATLNGETVALFGVTDRPAPRCSIIWMLGTPKLDEALVSGGQRLCRPWLFELVGQRRCVFNVVPVKNTRTIRWLRWLGFEEARIEENYRSLGHRCAIMVFRQLSAP